MVAEAREGTKVEAKVGSVVHVGASTARSVAGMEIASWCLSLRRRLAAVQVQREEAGAPRAEAGAPKPVDFYSLSLRMTHDLDEKTPRF